ncbi:MAG: YihY/virulence factor BrkB family protein [Paludibacter sp.]|nr:YihY/virulence factor BrkB family protein [Paludibacter sp.]
MSKLIAFFQRIYKFIRYDIWQITELELSRSRRFSYRIVKTLILAIRGFIDDKLNIRASALTYSILFAIVPLFALIIAIARGFGVEQMIEKSLEGSYIAKMGLIPKVMEFVQKYLETTQGGLFIGIGLAILFWSVMNFFMQVENAFNSIWQVKKSRSPIRQFTTYFSTILIIPLFIVLSSGFSIFVSSSLSQSYIYHVLSPFLRFGVKLIPYLLNWLVFTIMYMVIPNTRVRFFNALLAGLIAGSAFQLFQMLYINGQVYLSRYNVIYGSFAAIPLLLLWLQISCLIVLLGAEISFASQNFKNYDYEVDTKNISSRYKSFLTLFIAHFVVKQFEDQQPPLSSENIAELNKLPIRLVNQILSTLVDSGILIEVFNDTTKLKSYLPAIDINQLTLKALNTKIETLGSELFLTAKNEQLDDFWKKTLMIKDEMDKPIDELLVKDI